MRRTLFKTLSATVGLTFTATLLADSDQCPVLRLTPCQS